MKTKDWTIAITIVAALFSSPVVWATGATSAQGVPVGNAVTLPHRSAVGHKNSAKKIRHYSAVTLSAFEPGVKDTSSKLTEPALINAPPTPNLRGSTPVASSTGDSSVFKVNPRREVSLADDDDHVAFEQAAKSVDGAAVTSSGDADALGSEAVSVIDRIADKPKAKAIASGPLRVRVNDKALRASVQIPLSDH